MGIFSNVLVSLALKYVNKTLFQIDTSNLYAILKQYKLYIKRHANQLMVAIKVYRNRKKF